MSANPTNIQPFPTIALDDLVAQLVEAKRAEDAAKKHRIAVEERILALHPAREEGSETIAAGGFKLTITGALSYSVDDMDALREVTRKWDSNLIPIKTKAELDATGCKYLRRERPDLWKELANVVTVKPAKAAVKVGV